MPRDWVGLIITAVVLLSLFGSGYTMVAVYELCASGHFQWFFFVGIVGSLIVGRMAAQKTSVNPLLLMVVTGLLGVLTAFFPLGSFWLYTQKPFLLRVFLLVVGSAIAGCASLLGTWWLRMQADQRWMSRIQHRGYTHSSLMLAVSLALLIGLIFPSIGFVRSGFVCVPGFLFLMLVWMEIDERDRSSFVLAAGVILLGGWGWSTSLVSLAQEHAYPDSIIVQDRSIVVTKDEQDVRLYRNGNLRFSSIDSYRYYETLVHVPSTGSQAPMRNVLVLGAEGGLLVQEVLKYETVTRVDIVEHFDTASLVRKTPALRSLNHDVFDDNRVHIHEASLFDFVPGQQYDAIFMDLPEAGNRHTAQYYKREIFSVLLQALKKDGFLVTQAGSPFFSKFSFWEHVDVMSGLEKQAFVYPYHANVPSFGEWGFVILSRRALDWDDISLPEGVRFLTRETIPLLFSFSKDMLVSESG